MTIIMVFMIFYVCVRGSLSLRSGLLLSITWNWMVLRDGVAVAQPSTPQYSPCPTQGCPEYPGTNFSDLSHIQTLTTLSSPTTKPSLLSSSMLALDYRSNETAGDATFDETRDDFDMFLRLLREAGLEGPLSAADSGASATTIFVPRDYAMIQTAQDIRKRYGIEPNSSVARCKAAGAPNAEDVLSEAQVYDVLLAFAQRFEDPSLILGVLARNHIVPALVTLEDFLDTESWRSWADQIITRQGDALVTENSSDEYLVTRLLSCYYYLFDTRQGRLIQVDRMLIPDFSSFSLAPSQSPSAPVSATPSVSSSVLSAASAPAVPSQCPPPSETPHGSASTSTAPSQSTIPDISQAVVRVSPSSSLASISNSEEESASNSSGVCFPGAATVTVVLPSSSTVAFAYPNSRSIQADCMWAAQSTNKSEFCSGAVKMRSLAMRNLKIGDHVLTSTNNLNSDYSSRTTSSPVILFSHWDADAQFHFVTLHTSTHRISLSASHLLYVNGRRLQPAATVTVGDSLQTLSGPQRVVRVEITRQRGLYAPHTMSGDMFVDGVLVSCYTTTVPPSTAHSLLAPLRGVEAIMAARFPMSWLWVRLFRRVTIRLKKVFRYGASPPVSHLLSWISTDFPP